jgi:hypothetical protein
LHPVAGSARNREGRVEGGDALQSIVERLPLIASIAAMVLLLPAVGAHAANSGWMPLSAFSAHLKKLKAGNELPVAIDCRNDSKVAAVWKPFARVQTQPNTSGKDWYVIAQVEFRDFTPNFPFDKNPVKWRVVSRKIVQGGGGGTKLFCTIWHK